MTCTRWPGTHRKWDGRPVDGQDRYVYRVHWEARYGPIPVGRVLHHKCGNVWCINLRHLEVLSKGEHARLHDTVGAMHRVKTHCPRGHAYDEGNTYLYTMKNGRQARFCRACNRIFKGRL